MNPVQIIARKRDGRELTREEISYFIQGFAASRIPNYQMSAMAMAIYLKGMTAAETLAMTEEMVASGRKLTWVKEAVPVSEAVIAVNSGHSEAVGRAEWVPSSVPGTATIADVEEDEEELSGIDARDTVDLGEDSGAFATVTLDGSVNVSASGTRGARDTVELEMPVDPTVRFKVPRGAVVDKHSTGGLGDKTSLILAPLLACCGLRVPMISGRGLGATGGTLDKLESIPGFRTDLSLEEVQTVTERVGCVITGATADLSPADRKLYALRDVTGTVGSIPLITASIMSKKLAESLDALVLDVKWGSGAFMKTQPMARKLAESLVETGCRGGVKSVALLTNMDQPLGRMVGNTLEIDEILAALAGKGPADLWAVTCELGAELLVATERANDHQAARQMLADKIQSGEAFEKFREMVAAQGGNLDLPRSRTGFQFEIRANRSGYIGRMNAETLGLAVIDMGGGRRVLSDSIDHSVGLEMLVRIGDRVSVGQPLIRVHCKEAHVDSVKVLLRTAVPIRPQPVEAPPLISDRIG